jgi:hypothetical protein
LFGCSQGSARDLVAFGVEDSFSFQSVEVFGEAAAAGAEVVAFDEEGDEGVEFVE